MNGRYELKRKGQDAERGNRATDLDRAKVLLRQAVPAGEWFVWDRLEKMPVPERWLAMTSQERIDDYRRRFEDGEFGSPHDDAEIPDFDPANPFLLIQQRDGGTDAWAEPAADLQASAWECWGTQWAHERTVDLRTGQVYKVTGATFTITESEA